MHTLCVFPKAVSIRAFTFPSNILVQTSQTYFWGHSETTLMLPLGNYTEEFYSCSLNIVQGNRLVLGKIHFLHCDQKYSSDNFLREIRYLAISYSSINFTVRFYSDKLKYLSI